MESIIAKLIVAILAAAVLLMAVTLGFSKRRGDHLQVVYFLRFPIIAALLLLLLPLVSITSFSRIFGNIFAFESIGAVALVVWIAILVAWTVMYTALLIINSIPCIYGIDDYRPFLHEHPLVSWLSKRRVWLYALLALPTVIVIALKAEIWRNPPLSLCSQAGVAIGVALALFAAAAFYRLLTYLQATAGVQALFERLRQVAKQLAKFLRLPKSALRGFGAVDSDGIRHETAAVFLLILGILYLAGIYLYHPKQYQTVIPHQPIAAYILSLLMLLTWLLSGIAHFVDRYRLPTSLLILILTFFVALSPYTGHYYQVVPMTPKPVSSPTADGGQIVDTPVATPHVDTASTDKTDKIDATAIATVDGRKNGDVQETPQMTSPPLPYPDIIRNAQVNQWHDDPSESTSKANTPSEPGATPTPNAENPEKPDDFPLVIIMASGGGIQSAVWTARVLTGLQQDLGPDFVKSISLISAVSGGTVGAMYYVDSFTYAGPPPADHLDAIVAKAGESTVDQAAWGLFYPDLLRTFFGGNYGLGDGYGDRGWAMETAWADRLNDLAESHNTTIQNSEIKESHLYANRPVSETHVPTDTRLLSDWQSGVNNGWRPAAIFNATEAETGERFLFATANIPETWQTHSFNSTFPGYDIGVATAARMASTFPYASSLAKAYLSNTDLETIAGNLGYTDTTSVTNWNLADGGYYDNDGVVSGLQWLQWILESEAIKERPRRIVIIQILNTERATAVERCDSDLARQGPQASTVYSPTNQLSNPPAIKSHGSWINELFGPVLTVLSSRRTSQVQRGQTQIDTMIDLIEHQYADINVLYCVFDLPDSDVLSWHLAPSEFAKINDAWVGKNETKPERIQIRVNEIAYFLGIRDKE